MSNSIIRYRLRTPAGRDRKVPVAGIRSSFWITTLLFFIPTLFAWGCNKGNSPENDIAALSSILLTNSTIGSAICPTGSTPEGTYLADTVTEAPGSDPSLSYRDPQYAINGICGKGESQGSTDVYRTGSSVSDGFITLEWSNKRVTDGTGIDFIVYENPFQNGPPGYLFLEPIIVEVSIDNNNWCGFDPDYANTDETVYTGDPNTWMNFAGRTAVLYNQADNPLSKSELFLDANGDGRMDTGGGDGFDLTDLSDTDPFSTGCNTTIRNLIQTNGFVYLRLVNAFTRENPDTSPNTYPASDDSFDKAPDIDGVIARYVETR